jgi:hypothetical protein
MRFDYIRAIAPSPARASVDSTSDETDLAELVSHALERTPELSLACPMPLEQRLDLPRFSGITLADVALLPQPLPPAQPRPAPGAATSTVPRMLLGPGVMTMMIAVVATLAFGVFVVTH